MSKTFYENQILAAWTDTDRPEHLFKREYSQLAEVSMKSLGGPILLQLSKDDEHFLGRFAFQRAMSNAILMKWFSASPRCSSIP